MHLSVHQYEACVPSFKMVLKLRDKFVLLQTKGRTDRNRWIFFPGNADPEYKHILYGCVLSSSPKLICPLQGVHERRVCGRS